MGLARRIGVVVVVLALTTSLFGANLALGVERTVLDAGFVTSTLEEEDVYGQVLGMTQDRLAEAGANVSGNGDLPVSPEEILPQVVTEEYVRNQTETNVEAVIGYLHGDRDEFVVAIDLRPVKARAGEVITEEVQSMEPTELVGLFDESVAVDGPEGTELSTDLIGRLLANESSYEAARADFRSSIVDAVVANQTNRAFASASDDELLALVVEDYDPSAYDAAEKSQMVEDRESEIKAAIRSTIESEVSKRVDELLASQRSTFREAVNSSVGDADVDPALQDAFRKVALLGVDGLTADVSYDEFYQRALDTRDTLAVALSETIVDELDSEVPDRMDLTEDLDAGARESLATARTAVQTLDALAILLWVVALALLGALWWLTRSVATTALWSGVALLVAGSPVAIATRWAAGRVRTLRPTDPTGAQAFDIFVPVVDRVLGSIAAQSLVLAVVGLLLVGFWLADRLDLLPEEGPWDRLDRDEGDDA